MGMHLLSFIGFLWSDLFEHWRKSSWNLPRPFCPAPNIFSSRKFRKHEQYNRFLVIDSLSLSLLLSLSIYTLICFCCFSAVIVSPAFVDIFLITCNLNALAVCLSGFGSCLGSFGKASERKKPTSVGLRYRHFTLTVCLLGFHNVLRKTSRHAYCIVT